VRERFATNTGRNVKAVTGRKAPSFTVVNHLHIEVLNKVALIEVWTDKELKLTFKTGQN
jgi:hypothetical protein